MSKRDNKRFNDKDRKGAPKRGGKNRRDYGDTYTYEPKRKSSAGGRKAASQNTRSTGGAKRGFAKPQRDDRRRVLGFDMDAPFEAEHNVGNDGLEVVAGRNPVTEALNGEREVERIFIADGSEGSVSRIVAIAREQGVIVDFVPKEKIDAMAPGTKHQGVVAKVSEYTYADMDEVFEKAEAAGEDPFIVILDEGIRTVAGLNADHITIGGLHGEV
jgi:hypothetical protein